MRETEVEGEGNTGVASGGIAVGTGELNTPADMPAERADADASLIGAILTICEPLFTTACCKSISKILLAESSHE